MTGVTQPDVVAVLPIPPPRKDVVFIKTAVLRNWGMVATTWTGLIIFIDQLLGIVSDRRQLGLFLLSVCSLLRMISSWQLNHLQSTSEIRLAVKTLSHNVDKRIIN